MRSDGYLEFLGPTEIRIKGHRIGLEHIVEFYQEGYTSEEIAEEFPGLDRERIDAAIRYYLDNKAEVEAYLARLRALVAQRMRKDDLSEPRPVIQRLRALKGQRQSVQR